MSRSIRQNKLFQHVDWISVLLYTILVFMGWICIYAAVYDDEHGSIFDISQKYGKQLIWIGVAFFIAFVILVTDSKFFTAFSMIIYVIMIMALASVLVIGKEVNGARSWFEVGSIRIQPAEFAKFATCLAIAHVMSRPNFKIMQFNNLLKVGMVLIIPALLIILQNDTGSAIVYSSFILVMYREGLNGLIPISIGVAVLIFILSLLYSPIAIIAIVIAFTLFATVFIRQRISEAGIAFLSISVIFSMTCIIDNILKLNISYDMLLLGTYAVTSVYAVIHLLKKRIKKIIPLILLSWLCIGSSYMVNFAFDKLQPHQQDRINLLLGKVSDPKGIGYNVIQSKIAIGSGGFFGKGFLQGTQTKYNFVPEQSTDFIYCTVGEEWGFVGSSLVILLQLALILRIVQLSERQKSNFSRIYGFGVAGILLFHLVINVGMTIGLAPVVGIPLPFFSYGGSSLWAFTILIFIFLKLDSNRMQVLS